MDPIEESFVKYRLALSEIQTQILMAIDEAKRGIVYMEYSLKTIETLRGKLNERIQNKEGHSPAPDETSR